MGQKQLETKSRTVKRIRKLHHAAAKRIFIKLTFIVLSIPLVATTQSNGWHCTQFTTVEGVKQINSRKVKPHTHSRERGGGGGVEDYQLHLQAAFLLVYQFAFPK